MSDTLKRIREHVDEMFGPVRSAGLADDDAPWWQVIEAMPGDRLDMDEILHEEFGVVTAILDRSSLAEIARYIDATTPSPFPH